MGISIWNTIYVKSFLHLDDLSVKRHTHLHVLWQLVCAYTISSKYLFWYEKKMNFIFPVLWRQWAKFLWNLAPSNLSFLCTCSIVFITYFNWIYLFTYICPVKYMLRWDFLNLLGIQKGRTSEFSHLPHVFPILNKHQKFLNKIIRFIHFIEEQFSSSEEEWNSLEVGMNWKESKPCSRGDLTFYLLWLLGNVHFLFPLFLHSQSATFENILSY